MPHNDDEGTIPAGPIMETLLAVAAQDDSQEDYKMQGCLMLRLMLYFLNTGF